MFIKRLQMLNYRNYNALDIELNDEEVAYLEELYVPHPLKGPIIKN